MRSQKSYYVSCQLQRKNEFPFEIRLGQMSNSEETIRNFSGLAALSICESLLLALSDLKVLSNHDVDGVFDDAAATHRKAVGTAEDLEMHRAVVAIIERVRAGRHLTPN
jgi:hypothetical protein